MHAPEWVSRELERLHPQLRLGWMGQERLSPDEPLNKGSFFLLQLYHRRDAERTLHFAWESSGPIWGSRYDPLQRVPFVMQPLSNEEVFTGEVLQIVREMMVPLKERLHSAMKEEGKVLDAEMDDLAGEMGEQMYWNSKRHDAELTCLPDKMIAQSDKDIATGDVDLDMSDTFLKDAGVV